MHDTTAQLRGHAGSLQHISGGMHAVSLQHRKMSCFELQACHIDMTQDRWGKSALDTGYTIACQEAQVNASAAEGLHV